MKPVLVIGYGNPLRRDDGVGPHVAGRFENLDSIRVVVTHQLVPELADALAACRRVVFVDAAADADRVEVHRVEPGECDLCLGHVGDPAWLLGLTAALHGHCPPGWLVTVPACDLGFGEGFSPTTCAAVEDAVVWVDRLCRDDA